MGQKLKEKKPDQRFKTIKLDPQTHKLLRMYAVENDLRLGEAVLNLLNRIPKIRSSIDK